MIDVQLVSRDSTQSKVLKDGPLQVICVVVVSERFESFCYELVVYGVNSKRLNPLVLRSCDGSRSLSRIFKEQFLEQIVGFKRLLGKLRMLHVRWIEPDSHEDFFF